VSACVVTCHQCVAVDGLPRRWRWLCELCAEECQDRHREQTGHPTELTVVDTDGLDRLLDNLTTASAAFNGTAL